MIFKKNWPFTRLMNYYLLEMKEKGILDRYYYAYERNTTKSCEEEIKIRPTLKVPHPISLHTTISIFIVLFTGFLFSLVLFVLELVH